LLLLSLNQIISEEVRIKPESVESLPFAGLDSKFPRVGPRGAAIAEN
jgi:hypothetical protein